MSNLLVLELEVIGIGRLGEHQIDVDFQYKTNLQTGQSGTPHSNFHLILPATQSSNFWLGKKMRLKEFE